MKDIKSIIAEAREKVEAASKTPWVVDCALSSPDGHKQLVIRANEPVYFTTDILALMNSPKKANANFIVFACNNLAAILDEVERLEYLHNLDHSLADQWRDKNEKLEAENAKLREALECIK